MQALKSAGQNVDLEIITGVDHFDLVERLPDPDYSLAQASTVFLLPLTHPRLQTADVYVFFWRETWVVSWFVRTSVWQNGPKYFKLDTSQSLKVGGPWQVVKERSILNSLSFELVKTDTSSGPWLVLANERNCPLRAGGGRLASGDPLLKFGTHHIWGTDK